MRRLFGRKRNALNARSEGSSRKSSYKSSDNEDSNSDREKGTYLVHAFVQFIFVIYIRAILIVWAIRRCSFLLMFEDHWLIFPSVSELHSLFHSEL